MRDVAPTQLQELAQAVVRELGADLGVVPHDRFQPEATGWYLIRRPFETPTYRFAKFYLAEEDPESLIAAFMSRRASSEARRRRVPSSE